MRLIAVSSFEFVEYADERQAPTYGILSHRWQNEEVSYKDMLSGAYKDLQGFTKIKEFCRQCKFDGLSHAWVDTCCIDKNSSAELSEAINSMYRWYQNATKCYVYLFDVQEPVEIAESHWFERGWTLQELIAPNDVQFYSKTWESLGSKAEHRELIERVTKIPQDVLYGEPPFNYSIAQRMSWAARRITTRIEDQAYSLMGLFNVNMPMLYGEGEKAFTRLQEEIIKYSADHSIFAWPGIITDYDKSEMYDVTLRRLEGLLATSPAAFQLCGNIQRQQNEDEQQPFSVTNLGLSLEVLLRPVSVEVYEAKLNCSINSRNVSIFVRQTDQDGRYARHTFDGSLSRMWTHNEELREERVRVNVVQGLGLDPTQVCQPEIILYPGPLSQKWSNALPSTCFKARSETSPERTMIEVLNGAYEDVSQLQMEGGFEGLETIRLEFGFDFYFNPTLWIGTTHRRLTVESLRELQNTAPRTESVQMPGIGRYAVVKSNLPNSKDGWMFKGHRSKGVFIWLVGLNTVIDIRKKPLLSHNFWTIDIQKANPRNSHLLSSVKGSRKPGRVLLTPSDLDRELLTEQEKCPICLRFLAVPVSTSMCRHTFCQSCFKWANVSIKSTILTSVVTGGGPHKQTNPVLCPICGSVSDSYIDLHHQYKIQNKNPQNWRFASWKSMGPENITKFPAFEFLTFTIGNTHKITESPTTSRSGHPNRHDWTFYVRPSHPDLVLDVKIFLHESFRQNVIELTNPPFELRRFGWGTFEVQVVVALKSQYFYLHDDAIVENGRRSKLELRWMLSFWGDGDQGWLKVAFGRFKSRNTDYDLELLTQYGNLVALQAGHGDTREKLRRRSLARYTTPMEEV